MHADFATSAVALGKITMAKAAGEPISLGWAVDSEGQLTTDPEKALEGSLASAAGHKGWALGLLVEFLAAGMTGSVNSLDVQGLKAPDGPPHNLGQFYILIDPAAHSGTLADRIARVANVMAEDMPARIPGSQHKKLESVTVEPAFWQSIEALSAGPRADT